MVGTQFHPLSPFRYSHHPQKPILILQKRCRIQQRRSLDFPCKRRPSQRTGDGAGSKPLRDRPSILETFLDSRQGHGCCNKWVLTPSTIRTMPIIHYTLRQAVAYVHATATYLELWDYFIIYHLQDGLPVVVDGHDPDGQTRKRKPVCLE
ncbi:hypothetical protein LZ30DRAFT_397172 [Colletotrichum cereale]|nr:hypothetical protein LZ30DRAFT_397172 [Colletotrichum cereale]